MSGPYPSSRDPLIPPSPPTASLGQSKLKSSERTGGRQDCRRRGWTKDKVLQAFIQTPHNPHCRMVKWVLPPTRRCLTLPSYIGNFSRLDTAIPLSFSSSFPHCTSVAWALRGPLLTLPRPSFLWMQTSQPPLQSLLTGPASDTRHLGKGGACPVG